MSVAKAVESRENRAVRGVLLPGNGLVLVRFVLTKILLLLLLLGA